MAATRVSLCYACAFQVLCLIFNIAVANEYLAVDENLTRDDITTPIGYPVNLGCYVTKTNSHQTPATPAPTSLNYVWSKGNFSVTQSSSAVIHDNVLVVTPESDEDFGMYECNVTNGVSNTRCTIKLIRGWRYKSKDKKKKLGTGCVNVSVLMPVLAVAVLSCLLFVHLLIRRKEPKILLPSERRHKSTIIMAHPHAEQRRRSRDLVYNSFDNETLNNNEKKQEIVSIEMQAGSDLTSTPSLLDENPVDERRRKRRSAFSNKSFRHHSMDMDESEVGSQASDMSKYSSEKGASIDSHLNENKGVEASGFYNKTYKIDSIDSTDGSDGEVFARKLEETVGLDEPKRGKGKGFINKTYHSESTDLDDVDEARATGESVVDETKSGKGKGFVNETFKTESIDVADDKVGAQTAEDSVVEEPKDETAEHVSSMDTHF